MAILTQGTQVYMLVGKLDEDGKHTGEKEIIEIECATAFTPGGNPADQIETTCLSADVRAYLRGLRTPGQASLTVNADPRNGSHFRLYQLSESNEEEDESIEFFVGWADGRKIKPFLNTLEKGVITNPLLINKGSGNEGFEVGDYTVTISGDGVGATASVVLGGSIGNRSVVGIDILSEGTGYTYATISIEVTDNSSSPDQVNPTATVDVTTKEIGELELPETRTWFVFNGYVSDFPFDFAANTIVTTAATIQRSGGSAWIRKNKKV